MFRRFTAAIGVFFFALSVVLLTEYYLSRNFKQYQRSPRPLEEKLIRDLKGLKPTPILSKRIRLPAYSLNSLRFTKSRHNLKNLESIALKHFASILTSEYKFDKGEISYKRPIAASKWLKVDAQNLMAHPTAPKLSVGQSIPSNVTRQIFIATSWRSGSSFLGDLFNHYAGGFYYFEPLHYFRAHSVIPQKEGLAFLKDLYMCNFSSPTVKGWLRHTSGNHLFIQKHNTRWWEVCSKLLPRLRACFLDNIQEPFCLQSPIRIIKTVRVRVKLLEPLLQNTKDFPKLKMIVLVRDPRGTMHSRSSKPWCAKESCADTNRVCKDLDEDVETAYALAKKYPGQIYLLRYEDMCIDHETEIKSLFKFLDLKITKNILSFVEEHMLNRISKKKLTNSYSTFRDSKSIFMAWRNSVDMAFVDKVQNSCLKPMTSLGYNFFSNIQENNNYSVSVLRKTSEEVWPKYLS